MIFLIDGHCVVVVLGLAEYRGIDIWSVGCTLYELFTGEFLFKGRNNNDMLKCIMDYCGQFPYKLLRRCANVKDHFDPDDRFSFLHRVVDPVSNAVRGLLMHDYIIVNPPIFY